MSGRKFDEFVKSQVICQTQTSTLDLSCHSITLHCIVQNNFDLKSYCSATIFQRLVSMPPRMPIMPVPQATGLQSLPYVATLLLTQFTVINMY